MDASVAIDDGVLVVQIMIIINNVLVTIIRCFIFFFFFPHRLIIYTAIEIWREVTNDGEDWFLFSLLKFGLEFYQLK